MSNTLEVEETTYEVATVEEAVKMPHEYAVTRSWLGWTLRRNGSEMATMISPEEAAQILYAMLKAEEDDAEFQQRCLDEERGDW